MMLHRNRFLFLLSTSGNFFCFEIICMNILIKNQLCTNLYFLYTVTADTSAIAHSQNYNTFIYLSNFTWMSHAEFLLWLLCGDSSDLAMLLPLPKHSVACSVSPSVTLWCAKIAIYRKSQPICVWCLKCRRPVPDPELISLKSGTCRFMHQAGHQHQLMW